MPFPGGKETDMTVNLGFGLAFDFGAFIAALVMMVIWAILMAMAE